MYPYLLRECLFPVRHYSYRDRCAAREPQDVAEDFGVIAHVTIRTRVPEYPLRTSKGVIYPTGTFQTTLTGPELLQLRKDGAVMKCHRLTIYDLGRPFQAAAAELIRMRESARANGDLAWEWFTKLVSNALAGKLAQKRGEWVERRDVVPETQWGEWTIGTNDGVVRRRYRTIAGLTWEYLADKLGGGPARFAFCYLTALGRLHLRKIRSLCPPNSVVSQDTDGLWVTQEGLNALIASNALGGSSAGCLRVASQVSAARFFGPRHYWTDAGWTLAGFSAPTVMSNGLEVVDHKRLNPLCWSPDEPPLATFTRQRRVKLDVKRTGQVVDADGWAHPVHKG